MPTEDELRTCDCCGMPEALREGVGYRCTYCGQTWTAAERAEVEDDDDDAVP